MADLHVNHDLLHRFEAGIDLRRPERSAIPAHMVGQGRISTVLTIEADPCSGLVYKRLPVFRSMEEAKRYEALHRKYVRTLGERTGLRVMPCTTAHVQDATTGRVAVYIIQELAPEDTAGHGAIYHLSPADINRLLLNVLQETAKVFDFNRDHQASQESGFDPRLSNWAILGFDPNGRLAGADAPGVPGHLHAADAPAREGTTRHRAVPARHAGADAHVHAAVPLNDLLSRYYDFRRAAVDLIANLHTEGRADLVPWLTDTVNWFFLAERDETHFRPLTIAEVEMHTRPDVFYWRTYRFLRRLNRLLGR